MSIKKVLKIVLDISTDRKYQFNLSSMYLKKYVKYFCRSYDAYATKSLQRRPVYSSSIGNRPRPPAKMAVFRPFIANFSPST